MFGLRVHVFVCCATSFQRRSSKHLKSSNAGGSDLLGTRRRSVGGIRQMLHQKWSHAADGCGRRRFQAFDIVSKDHGRGLCTDSCRCERVNVTFTGMRWEPRRARTRWLRDAPRRPTARRDTDPRSPASAQLPAALIKLHTSRCRRCSYLGDRKSAPQYVTRAARARRATIEEKSA